MNLKLELNNFTGTMEWHRWSKLYPRFVLTDGAKFLAEEAQAYWLMDLIASHQTNLRVRSEPFQVWTLEVKSGVGFIVCDDGNGNILAKQSIAYTDFLLDEIKLYAVYEDHSMVIMLPSEY